MIRKNYNLIDSYRMYGLNTLAFLLATIVPLLFFPQQIAESAILQWIFSGVATFALLGVVLLYSKRQKIDWMAATKIDQKPTLLQVVLGLGCVLGLMIMLLPVADWFVELLEKLGFPGQEGVEIGESTAEIVLAGIIAVFLAGFCEEVFMRGVIAHGFARRGIIKASLISGILFAIFHMNPATTVYQFVLGVALGFFVLWSGNLWVGIIMHVFNNALALVSGLVITEEIYNFIFVDYVALTMFVGAVIAVTCVYLFVKKVPNKFDNRAESEEYQLSDAYDGTNMQPKPQKNDIVLLGFGIGICVLMWITTLLSR